MSLPAALLAQATAIATPIVGDGGVAATGAVTAAAPALSTGLATAASTAALSGAATGLATLTALPRTAVPTPTGTTASRRSCSAMLWGPGMAVTTFRSWATVYEEFSVSVMMRSSLPSRRHPPG